MNLEEIKKLSNKYKGIPTIRHIQIVNIIEKITKDKEKNKEEFVHPNSDEIHKVSSLTKHSVNGAIYEIYVRGWIDKRVNQKDGRYGYFILDKWYDVIEFLNDSNIKELSDYPTRSCIRMINIIREIKHKKEKRKCKVTDPTFDEIKSLSSVSEQQVRNTIRSLLFRGWLFKSRKNKNEEFIYTVSDKWFDVLKNPKSDRFEELLGNPSKDSSIKCSKCGKITHELFRFKGDDVCGECFCPSYEVKLENHVKMCSSACYGNF